jgi:CRISPR/Cas system-associated protein endoribonuclease Cas2
MAGFSRERFCVWARICVFSFSAPKKTKRRKKKQPRRGVFIFPRIFSFLFGRIQKKQKKKQKRNKFLFDSPGNALEEAGIFIY